MGDIRDADLRARLQAELSLALRRRDRRGVALMRATLGAVANAEAPALATVTTATGVSTTAGALEASPVGVGVGEIARLELTDADVTAVVRREAAELRAAAAVVAVHRPGAAAELRHDADTLEEIIAADA